MKLYQFSAIMGMLFYISYRLSPDSIATAFMVFAVIFFVLTLICGIAEFGSGWKTQPWRSGPKVEPKQEPKWF